MMRACGPRIRLADHEGADAAPPCSSGCPESADADARISTSTSFLGPASGIWDVSSPHVVRRPAMMAALRCMGGVLLGSLLSGDRAEGEASARWGASRQRPMTTVAARRCLSPSADPS